MSLCASPTDRESSRPDPGQVPSAFFLAALQNALVSGDVNLFHGRIHQGRVDIGQNQLEAPEWADARDQAGVAYVRTYDVERAPIRTSTTWLEAVVRHVRAFGPVVRLELDLVERGRTIEAHVPRARFDGMALAKGQRVCVSPTHVRVFAAPRHSLLMRCAPALVAAALVIPAGVG